MNTGDEVGGESAPLSQRVRVARSRVGWSRETLAHHAGLSWAAIVQIESGRRTDVRSSTLSALASALGVTVDYLLGSPPDRGLLAHWVLLYASSEEFLGATVPFLRDAAGRAGAALVVTTRASIDLLTRELGPARDGIRFEDSARWYRSPMTTEEAYRAHARDQLTSGSPWVSIVGEPVWTDPRDIDAWITYESLLNLTFASWPVTVMCPYDVRALDPSIIDSARHTHPMTMVGTSPAPNPQYEDPAARLFGGGS